MELRNAKSEPAKGWKHVKAEAESANDKKLVKGKVKAESATSKELVKGKAKAEPAKGEKHVKGKVKVNKKHVKGKVKVGSTVSDFHYSRARCPLCCSQVVIITR